MSLLRRFTRWLTPGLGIKRWFVMLALGILLLVVTISLIVVALLQGGYNNTLQLWIGALVGLGAGLWLITYGVVSLVRRFLQPYRQRHSGEVYDTLHRYSLAEKGVRVVAIGGGTGLPSVLRGLKPFTKNLTSVVTMADDGGSSGRLRTEMGVLPPGDLRNNIVALADDESLMAKLFQYRFETGDLKGHAFGNLFISALEAVTGSIESALIETERVLNITGRVLPSTLQDVNLAAWVIPPGGSEAVWVQGESNITHMGGKVQQLCLEPGDVEAYAGSVDAITRADMVVIGPGSLYTSILPNLLVQGIADALRATDADIVYVCNVATQPGETEDFTVADHVLALEKHIGRGVFNVVLANNAYPTENAGENTRYVPPVPATHDILQRYQVTYADLTDGERPWRHDPIKLAGALLRLRNGTSSSVN
ncbi:MAG: uridine diphosphate-N-acetylglucosamine-binding protein YvcK [Chloroflexota bacterium]|nr:uridine diphosphate-N-acetylglucosamine-binding protein YvcK [Chloroflexota bacterium]